MSTTTITVSRAQVRAAQALTADTDRYGTPRDGVALIAVVADKSTSTTPGRASRRIGGHAAPAQ